MILEGDEWKHEEEEPVSLTRAEEQSRINAEFSAGRMTAYDWSRAFDELSDPECWSASGPRN